MFRQAWTELARLGVIAARSVVARLTRGMLEERQESLQLGAEVGVAGRADWAMRRIAGRAMAASLRRTRGATGGRSPDAIFKRVTRAAFRSVARKRVLVAAPSVTGLGVARASDRGVERQGFDAGAVATSPAPSLRDRERNSWRE